MQKLKISAGCAVLLCIAGTGWANSQVLDPSFTSGFGSDYTYVGIPGPTAMWAEGTYAVGVNPNDYHYLWSSFTAPSEGDMLIANGAVTAGERVWYETIGPGTYDFNALVANNYSATEAVSPADLVLELDGVMVGGSEFINELPAGNWEAWSASFTASGSQTLAIVDLNLAADGNDFSIAGVPDGGTTSLMLGMGVLALGWVRRMVKK